MTKIDSKNVARGLGLFGIGLGLAELIAPKSMARLNGLEGQEGVIQAFGAREIASGIPLLRADDPAPWLWVRVAGDALDGGLLGTGLAASDSARRKRALLATLAVAPVVALDLIYALKGRQIERASASQISASAAPAQ